MACSRPKAEHCVPSRRSGSWGSSPSPRSEPTGQYHCKPCPLREVGEAVGNGKGAQWMSARSWVILGSAQVEGVAGSSKGYTWGFVFITMDHHPLRRSQRLSSAFYDPSLALPF